MRNKLYRAKLAWMGILLVIFYLLIESLVHIFYFKEGNILGSMLSGTHSAWNHLFIIFILLWFGFHAQQLLDKSIIAEREQKEEKNKLESLIGAIEYGLTIVDKDYNITYQNEALKNFLGDHIGERCYTAFYGRNNICDGCQVQMAFNDGKSHTVEREITSSAGETVFIENTANPIRNAEGEVVSCLEIIRNVTEKKRNEEERKRYIHELQIINDTIFKASRLERVDEICQLIGETAQSLNPDAYVAVSYYDWELEAIKIQEIIGLDEAPEEVFELIGDPRGLIKNPSEIGEEAAIFTTGKMEKVNGIYELMAGEIPQDTCDQIEKMLGIEASYTVGFALGDEPYGGISIMNTGQDVQYQNVIETLASHFSVLIGRRQSDEALIKSEKKYREVVENASEIIVVTQDGMIKFANSATSEISGFTLTEITSRPFIDFIHEDDKEMVRDHHIKRLNGDEDPQPYEVRLIAKDGSIVWLRNSGVIVDWEGNPATLNFLTNITEMKQKEEEIHRLNQFQKSIIDDANVWLDVLDENANVLIWNKAAEQISGYSKEEVIGHNKIWEWLYPDEDYRKQITEKAAEIIEGNEVEEFETTITTKDGQERIISWHSRNLLDNEDSPVGSIAIGRDVTEQKRAEKALKESEERYRTTFEHTGTAMMIIEEDKTVSLVNEEFEELSGYPREEIEGKMNWTEFIHPQDLEWMKEYHMERREEKEVPTRYEFRAIDREGSTKNILLTIEMLPNTKKSICSMTDITLIKKLNNLLKVTTKINELVAREKNPDVVLESVCENLILLYDGVFAALGNDTENLEPVKSKDMNLKTIKKSISNCPSVRKAMNGKVEKLRANRRVCNNCPDKGKYALSIPLLHEEYCYGVINIHSDFDLTEEEIDLLEKLASNIAFALNAYDLERDKKDAMQQLAKNLTQFDRSADRLRNPLAAIMATLELRDHYDEVEILDKVDNQTRRIKEELDKLREEEDNTYRLVRERLQNEGYSRL